MARFLVNFPQYPKRTLFCRERYRGEYVWGIAIVIWAEIHFAGRMFGMLQRKQIFHTRSIIELFNTAFAVYFLGGFIQ